MEELLLHRLKLRRDRLASHVEAVQAECEAKVAEARLKTAIHELKSFIEKLDNEIKYYTANSTQLDTTHVNESFAVQLKAEDLVVVLESCLSAVTVPKSPKEAGPSTTRLPKLDLPTFDGDQLKWNEFWDRFEASVDCKSIANADKMSYLLSCVEGPAKGAVAGLAVSNDNYKIAVQSLKQRFGSPQRTIDAHYSALSNLERANDTSTSCRNTLDTIEQHLRVLECLGEPPNGNHLRSMILTKFPPKVLHELYILCGDDVTSMAVIRRTLNMVVAAMEQSSLLIPNTAVDATVTLEPSQPMTTEVLLTPVIKKSKRTVNNKRKAGKTGIQCETEQPKTKKPRLPCLFCNLQNHYSSDCRKVRTAEARKEKLSGRCLRCLRRNHTTEQCKSKRPCYMCKGDHAQVLCPQVLQTGENAQDNVEHDKYIANTNCATGYTFLQTAVAVLKNPSNNQEIRSRILLDSGSQRSYITTKTAKTLNLTADKEDLLLIYTFGSSTPREISSPSVNVIVKTKRGINRMVHVNIVPRITENVPVNTFDYDVDIPADDASAGEGIDLLLGNDYISSFTRENKVQTSTNLYLIDTDFGWVLSGSATEEDKPNILSVTTYCRCHESSCPYFTQPDLPLRNIDMQFLWSLESIGITDSPKATHQEEAVRHFNETVQLQNGRYEVKWPWVEQNPDLASNFGLAYGRLKSLIKRLDKCSLEEYDNILQEQMASGVIEECKSSPYSTDQDSSHLVHYLPHHMVKQTEKKGRIVYDASAKTSGKKSLNECLYSGPSMLEDLTGLILKCRAYRIGIMADVEKAFLQLGLQTEDRDVTRFLWLKDIHKEPTEDNLLHLRFCRVPFGIISSPFLLNATIRHHLSQSNKELLKTIADKCYVDNLIIGVDSTQQAQDVYHQTRTAFDQISMNIRDWVSNDKEFLDTIPEQHRSKIIDQVKMLGLIWDTNKDTLTLNVTNDHFTLTTPEATKREVLRILARIYDPCGFVCPVVLPMKILFQSICQRKLKWDEILPKDLTETLEMVLKQLMGVIDVELPRYIGSTYQTLDTSYELHCFSDASKEAYAAVIYLVSENQHGRTASFVMGKSHVSRIEDKNELRIPRLELLGFLIGSRLLTYVMTNLELPVQKKYLWTDSQVVLSWMRSDKLLPPFVANRVNEIKRKHTHTQMMYVNTRMNPADVATRPELWQHKRELWQTGPEFLRQEETFWPETRYALFSVGEALDVGNPGDIAMENSEPLDSQVDHDNVDTVMEIVDKDTLKIKCLQREHFPDEMKGKETHLSRNLDLYLDFDGVLRCGGRMANTTWSYDMKHPILLPKNCEFTDEIIKKIHMENYHVGAAHTLSLIRRHYWIPQGKAQVQKLIKKCPQCTRHAGGPYKLPNTPALPPERVNYNTPYTYTGVDYFGPLYVDSASGKEKRWVTLFTCLTVRAIHLEVVNDLTADECLLALRRFMAANGIPKRLYSDNATYFKLTSEVVAKPYCVEKMIQWKFIPQLAPWHGGFYERLVALVKHCLKRTLDKQLLKDSALHTILKEVQAVVNTRPLTSVGTEVVHILRPSDFLSLGKCLTVEPTSEEITSEGTIPKTKLIESWKRGLQILEEFKQMFIGQYLSSLRERYQYSPKQPRVRSDRTPEIGDLVQIKSDSKNRLPGRSGGFQI